MKKVFIFVGIALTLCIYGVLQFVEEVSSSSSVVALTIDDYFSSPSAGSEILEESTVGFFSQITVSGIEELDVAEEHVCSDDCSIGFSDEDPEDEIIGEDGISAEDDVPIPFTSHVIGVVLDSFGTFETCSIVGDSLIEVSQNQELSFFVECNLGSIIDVSDINSPVLYFTINGAIDKIITFNNLKKGESLNIESDLVFTSALTQQPNRILNGFTDSDRVVQPRSDKADISYSQAEVTMPGFQPSYLLEDVYPHQNSGNDRFTFTSSSNCSGSYCYTTGVSYSGICDGEYCSVSSSGNSCSVNINMDIPNLFNLPTIHYYNPSLSVSESEYYYFDSFTNSPVDLDFTVKLPMTFPLLVFNDNSAEKTKTYQVKDYLGLTVDANFFLKNGGSYEFPRDAFQSRAIVNGNGGVVDLEVKGSVKDSIWKYQYTGNSSVSCSSKYYYNYCRYHKKKKGGHWHGCWRDKVVGVSFPVYKWVKQKEEIIEFESFDQNIVSVFSSTAWVQTKGGNMGTNNEIATSDTEFSQFKYSSGEDLSEISTGSCDGISCVLSKPLDYTPQDQNNADFMVFAKPDSLASGGELEDKMGSAKFTSGADWYSLIEDNEWTTTSKSENKYGYDSRGKEYDRAEKARSFKDDLLKREMYGEVIDFSTLSDEQLLHYGAGVTGNATRSSNTFTFKNILQLDKGKIYYFPIGYTVILGNEFSDLNLKGSSVRLHVEDEVRIDGNVVYGNSTAKSYLDVPNLRIDANVIKVHGRVEFLESQIRADIFYSGVVDYNNPMDFIISEPSSIQLKILGDVIANKTHFQRSPAGVFNPQEMENNPPSEMIIEDMRKYIVPAPGDTVMRESHSMWQQVNPLTGEVVDPY